MTEVNNMAVNIPALTSFRGGCRGACGVTYGIIIIRKNSDVNYKSENILIYGVVHKFLYNCIGGGFFG